MDQPPTGSVEPTVELLQLPGGYGTPSEPLAWSAVREELASARQYWFATVRPDGRPHVVPLDGMWTDDGWYYGGSPTTVHAQSVLTNPEAVMHLPDPWRAVIVEGRVDHIEHDASEASAMAARASAKYPEYGEQPAEHYTTVRCLRPRRVLAWTSFPTNCTRFVFP
jgi:nitroimidazol reductase NimA-like FMN-containing flavoprotein (pyridoxamine 5'-phosphate oxidase superfamily)